MELLVPARKHLLHLIIWYAISLNSLEHVCCMVSGFVLSLCILFLLTFDLTQLSHDSTGLITNFISRKLGE